MGVNNSFPARIGAGPKSQYSFCDSSYNHPMNQNDSVKKKRKASKFATLRKKLTRVRRHSRSYDNGKIIQEMLSSFSINDTMALVQEYEATAILKEFYVDANLARTSASSLRQDLAKLYDQGYCTDVDLIFKNRCIPAHRAILCARSPYFKTLLSRYPEPCAQVPVTLKTPGIDSSLFSDLIRYLYTEDLGTSGLELQNKELLGSVAREFGIPNLLEHDLKQMMDSAEYSDAVLVFSTDLDHGEVLSHFHQSCIDGREQASNCDITGSGHRNEFYCHKAILASRSPFFRNLINRRAQSEMELSDRTVKSPTRIVLDESVIPKRYARVLLNALYQDCVDMSFVFRGSNSMCSLSEVQAMVSSGRCRMTIADEAMELYQIGQFLDSQMISQGCEDIIIENLTADCLINILNWSEEPHGSKWVYRQALSFLIEEFSQLAHSQILMDLDKEHLKAALSSDFLQCAEADILKAVISWGEHNLIKRIEESEPNLLSHTAHSIVKKGVKKRDLNNAELKSILSELLPLVKIEHILPSNSDILMGAVKRGLLERPAWYTFPDDAVMYQTGAWTGLTDRAFSKPRLFTPFYEGAKSALEDQLSKGGTCTGDHVRTVRISAMPDTLYMLEATHSRLPVSCPLTPVSTVDIIAGTIPIPDEETFDKMLAREQELLNTESAQRAISFKCSDRQTLAGNVTFFIQLRVVREFGLPDNTIDVLQNKNSHAKSKSYPQLSNRESQANPHRSNELKRLTSPLFGAQYNHGKGACGESSQYDVMPDIAMASKSFSQIHIHDEEFLTDEHQTLYI